MNGNWCALCILSEYVRVVGAPPSVAQNTFIFTLFKECGCMCLSNYISVHPECIMGLFSPVLCSCLVVIGQPRKHGSGMNGAYDMLSKPSQTHTCVFQHFLELQLVGEHQYSVSLLHSHDTDTRATMNMAISNGVIAAGQDGTCCLMRFKHCTQMKDGEAYCDNLNLIYDKFKYVHHYVATIKLFLMTFF